jgi:hypothetical protein
MDLELSVLLGTALALFVGLLAYCFWSTPRCKACGANVKWSRDTLCEACKEEQRDEESARRQSFTDAVLGHAVADPGRGGGTCPACGSRRIGRASAAERRVVTEASYAFRVHQCRDCGHAWATRRNRALLLGMASFASLALLAEVGGLAAFTWVLVKEMLGVGVARAAAGREYLALVYGAGLGLVGFTAGVLWYSVAALRLKRKDRQLPETHRPTSAPATGGPASGAGDDGVRPRREG